MSINQHPIFQIGRQVWLTPKSNIDDLCMDNIYRGRIGNVQLSKGRMIFHGKVDYESVRWNSNTYYMFPSEDHAIKHMNQRPS